MSLERSRTYGLVGSSLLLLSTLLLVTLFRTSPGLEPSTNPIVLIVAGVPVLIGFFALLYSIESISKAVARRSAVDSFVMALAFGSVGTAVSQAYGLNSSLGSTSILAAPFTIPLVTNASAVGYALVITFHILEGIFFLICLRILGGVFSNRIFLVAGVAFFVGEVVGSFVGSYVSIPILALLIVAFWASNVNKASTGGWTEVPKARVSAFSSLWFTDDGVFRVSLWLTNAAVAVYFILWVTFLVGQPIFQRYDVQGNLSPPTTTENVVENLAIFVLLCGFVLASRRRYPEYVPIEATRNSLEEISWDEFTSVKIRGSRLVMWLLTYVGEYEAGVNKDDRPGLIELLQRKLGDKFVVASG